MKIGRWIVLLVLLILPIHVMGQEKELLIGLIPEQNIFRQYKRYLPLADYLSERLKRPVRLTILSRYGDIVKRFRSRGMDGAFFGVLTGYIAIKRLGVEPIVVPIEMDGTSETYGYIIVRADSGIRSVEDMRGKVIAFVDKATLRGYLFPLVFLKRHGVKDIRGFFREYYFTGSNDASVMAVVDGRADIGVVKADIFEAILQRDPTLRKELSVIAKSPPMPVSILCIRSELPESLKRTIRESLVNLNSDSMGIKVLQQMRLKGFREASMEDFITVEEFFTELGLELHTYLEELLETAR